MAALTLYFKNAVAAGATLHRSLQNGGSAPASATTTTGWVVQGVAVGQSSLMAGGSERATSSFGSTLQPAAGPSAAGDCWRSENLLVGTFSAGSWTFSFGARSVSSAASGTMRLRVRVWRSSNVDGSSATELTSSTLTSNTVGPLSTSVDSTFTVSWTPGALAFANEYLFVQCALEIVTASTGGNNKDFDFRVGSAYTIVTPNFAGAITGTLSQTQASDTSAGAGTLAVVGAFSRTQAGDSLSAHSGPRSVGVLYSAQILSGHQVYDFQRTNLSTAQASNTLVAVGHVSIAGTLTRTQANNVTVPPSGGLTFDPNGINVFDTQRSVSGRIYARQRLTSGTGQAPNTLVATGTVTTIISGAVAGPGQAVFIDGDVDIAGTVTQTQADQTLVGAGTVSISHFGSAAYTQANQTLSGQVQVSVMGTLTQTQANQTASGQGQLTLVGSLARTQANQTLAATASVPLNGALSRSQVDQTLAATATTVMRAQLAATQAGNTLAATGAVAIGATLARTQDDHHLFAAQTITSTGGVTQTQQAHLLAAAATLPLAMTAALVAAPDTLTAAATITAPATGTLARTQAANTLAAVGTLAVVATLAYSEANATLTAQGVGPSAAPPLTLNQVQQGQTLAGDGTVGITAQATLTQTDQTAAGAVSFAIVATVDYLQEDQSLTAGDQELPPFGDVMVKLTLVIGTGQQTPAPPMLGLKYAFFEGTEPQLLVAPVQTGDDAVIDADGICTIVITNTRLQPGEVGFIILSNNTSDPGIPWKAHAGPVQLGAP